MSEAELIEIRRRFDRLERFCEQASLLLGRLDESRNYNCQGRLLNPSDVSIELEEALELCGIDLDTVESYVREKEGTS